MDILKNAKEHFNEISGTLRKIEVPEWGDESGPAVIYAKPLNMAQKSEIFALSNADKLGESLFLKIYHMARNEDGSRIFKRTDSSTFLIDIDPDIVSNVAIRLDSELSEEDIRKN